MNRTKNAKDINAAYKALRAARAYGLKEEEMLCRLKINRLRGRRS